MAEKKKKSCCCTALIITLIVVLVLLITGVTVGLIYANKFLKSNYDMSVNECWQLLKGMKNTKGVVTDEADENDETEMYSEIKKLLFLNENADLKGLVEDVLDDAVNESEEEVPVLTASADDSGNSNSEAELMNKIAELYADGNVDLTRLREYIENDVDVESVYETDFTARIKGNGFAVLLNEVLAKSFEKDSSTAEMASSIKVCQVGFSKNQNECPTAKVIVRIKLRSMLEDEINEALSSANLPGFVKSMILNLFPQETYLIAEVTFSKPATLSLGINNISYGAINKLFAVLSKAEGTDLKAEIDAEIEETVASIRNDMPVLIEILKTVDSDGALSVDAYGIIADALNKDKEDSDKLTGKELVSFVIGALGSDEEKAVRKRIEENSEFGEPDWENVQARKLVTAMSEAFALADSYFVNGTDENGNKILSVDNGTIIGSDKIIGRVYSDAAGNLYYKKSGGKYKTFVSADKQVSTFKRSGFDTYYSTGLHYTSGGKDYTLYKSKDGSVIYGISGSDVQNKNGTYTELTTLYVDLDGNVYSKQNSQGTLIEITKEKLTVNTIFNIVDGDNVDENKILDFIDFASLRQNGISSWLEPVRITEAQLAAMVNEVIDRYLGDDIQKAEPGVAYAGITSENGSDFVTLGITLKISALAPEQSAEMISTLLGDTVYIEVKCDVTLSKAEGAHMPVEIRYNDLNGKYTDDMISTLSKIAGETNLTGELENAAREIRSTIKNLNDTVKIKFVSGAVETDSPAAIILPLITDKTVDEESFVKAVDLLLRSDSSAAVALIENQHSDFSGENWLELGINTLAVNLTEAFILKKDEFLSDDRVNYSLDKIMDIIENDGFELSDIEKYLDYATMKEEGFTSWKSEFVAPDVSVAAIVDRVKDDGFVEFDSAEPEIEYVHVYKKEGREFVSIALSLRLKSLFDDNETFGRILDVLDDKMCVEITVDVTGKADSYIESVLKLNDLTESETDEIFDVISLFDAGFSKAELFGEIETQIRSSLDSIREGINFTFEEGKVVFAAPQEIIYGAIIENPSDDFTATDMTDALTAFAVSSNAYYKENGGFEADTASDAAYLKFWNDTLKEKYFMDTDVNSLFSALTDGGNVYGTLINAIDKTLFAPGGVYAHTVITDADYKAGNAQLAYLFRANSSAMADMFGSDVMKNIEIYDTRVVSADTDVGVKMTITVPSNDVIANMGDVSESVRKMLTSILPEKTAVDLSWVQKGSSVAFTINGMEISDRDKVEKLIESVTGKQLFADGSEISEAAASARDYFEDSFEYGVSDGVGYVKFASFYELVAKNVFAPKSGKDDVSANDVYELMKTLYERPETNGVFDSSLTGYVSSADDVKTISKFVTDKDYGVVGAKETIVVSFTAPEAKLLTTVKYLINLSGDAAKVLPEYVYITFDYDANPVVSATGVDISNSYMTCKFNVSENSNAFIKCLDYLDVDVNAATDKACEQLDSYVMSVMSV